MDPLRPTSQSWLARPAACAARSVVVDRGSVPNWTWCMRLDDRVTEFWTDNSSIT